MGRHGVSPHLHGFRPALRQARRPLRTQADPPGSDSHLPRRLGVVRARAEHGATDRVPSDSGPRRRRTDRDDARRHRRPDPPPRTRQVSGYWRRLRSFDGDRAATRWLFVDNLSWRRIFFVNLLVGVALADRDCLPRTRGQETPRSITRGRPLAAALSAVILFTSLGGTTWARIRPRSSRLPSPASCCCRPSYRRVARSRAILPLALFRNHTFTVTSMIGFIVGFALFGAVTYLPLYLQVTKGLLDEAACSCCR